MAEASVTFWHQGNARIVSFAGAAKVHEVPALNVEITRFLHDYHGKPPLVVIDLSGLNCISSLFIGSLLKLHKGVVAAGGRTVGVEAPSPVFAVCKVVYLDKVIPFAPSVEKAVASAGVTPA